MKKIKISTRKILESLGKVNIKVGKGYIASQPYTSKKNREGLGHSDHEPHKKPKKGIKRTPVKISKVFLNKRDKLK